MKNRRTGKLRVIQISTRVESFWIEWKSLFLWIPSIRSIIVAIPRSKASGRRGNKVERPPVETRQLVISAVTPSAWILEHELIGSEPAWLRNPRLTMLSVRAKSARRANWLWLPIEPIVGIGSPNTSYTCTPIAPATRSKGKSVSLSRARISPLFSLRSWSDFIYLV